jgi:hypothetical protein
MKRRRMTLRARTTAMIAYALSTNPRPASQFETMTQLFACATGDLF